MFLKKMTANEKRDLKKTFEMFLDWYAKKEKNESRIKADNPKLTPDEVPDILVKVLWKDESYPVGCKDFIAEEFTNLDNRHRYVIAKRFGFFGEPLATLEEVARAFSVTRERIRSLEKKALKKLKDACYPEDVINMDDDDNDIEDIE